MTGLREKLLVVAAAFLLPIAATGQESSDDASGGNWMESLFNSVQEAAEDPQTQEEGKDAVGNALDFLNQLGEESAAAREELEGSQYLTPEQLDVMMDDVNRRIQDVHEELDATRTRAFVTRLDGMGTASTYGQRIGPLQVLGSGLQGSEILRLIATRDVAVMPDGTILMAGHYARHGFVGTAPVRSSTASLATDGVDVPAQSELRPEWLLEGFGDAGSSVAIHVEPAADGAYALALSQGGPTHVGTFTVEHSQFDSLAYLTRLDSNGEPRWIAPLARPRFDPRDAAMASTPDGRIYVGYVLELLGGVPTATEQDVRTGAATYGESYADHQLLAAYSPNGTRLWQTITENVEIVDLETDDDGALYAVGHFSGSSGFCGGIQTDGDQAALVARFSPDGTCDWVRTTSGSTGRRDIVNQLQDQPGEINSFPALAVDGNSVYVGGSFYQDTEFGGQTFAVDNGSSTGLIARLDARTGEILWIKMREAVHDAGAPPVVIQGGYVYTAQIVPDDRGNIYVLEPRHEWRRAGEASGVRIDARVVKMDSRANVLWQESTGVSTAYFDSGGNQPKGVQLVHAAGGPPYLLVQNLSFSMAGVTLPDVNEGVWLVAIGRLGR